MPDYQRFIGYGEVYAYVQGDERADAKVSYNLNQTASP